MTCREVEDKLPAYVDGASSDAAQIATHLESCPACRASAHAQSAARTVLRARAAELSAIAPPGLRTRLRALTDDRATARQAAAVPADGLLWTRLSAFAAAAVVVLTLGAV